MLLSFGQVSLRRAVPRRPLPAASSRWLSATSLPVCTGVLTGQQLCHGAPAGQQLLPDAAAAADLSAGVTPRSGAVTFPHRLPFRSIPCSASASNKPHPAAKSTPVWLAIWRIWAGFANSQQRCAAFRSIYLYTCAHPHCCHPGTAAQTDANLSAHLHRLPTPPTYLRRMRLLPGRGAGVGWQMLLLIVRGTVPANHRAHFKNVNYL